MNAVALLRAAIARVVEAPSAPPGHEPLALPCGERLVVRPMRPQDADAEQVFVRSLSPQSRALRFHVGLRELPPQVLRALTEIDPRRHVALVVQRDGGDGAIVADARYVREEGDAGVAEFAIAVADAWQGRGLGRRLLARLIEHAREHGVRRLFGEILQENRRMLALARDAGGRFVGVPGDTRLTRVVFDL